MKNATVAAALGEPVRAHRQHANVAGHDLDELVRRLAGEPIAFSLTEDGSWSAMTYSGEYSAHGETLSDVLEQLLPELPMIRPRWRPTP